MDVGSPPPAGEQTPVSVSSRASDAPGGVNDPLARRRGKAKRRKGRGKRAHGSPNGRGYSGAAPATAVQHHGATNTGPASRSPAQGSGTRGSSGAPGRGDSRSGGASGSSGGSPARHGARKHARGGRTRNATRTPPRGTGTPPARTGHATPPHSAVASGGSPGRGVTGSPGRAARRQHPRVLTLLPHTHAHRHAATPTIRPALMRLPDDVLKTVLAYMQYPSLAAMTQVCQRGREVAGADAIWKKLYRATHGAGRRPPGCSTVVPWRWMYAQRECQRLFRGWYVRRDFAVPAAARPPTHAAMEPPSDDAGGSGSADVGAGGGAESSRGTRASPTKQRMPPPTPPQLGHSKSSVNPRANGAHRRSSSNAGSGGGEGAGDRRARSMSVGDADGGDAGASPAKPPPPRKAGPVVYVALVSGGKLLAATDRGEAAVWSMTTDSLLKQTNPSLCTSAIEAKKRRDAKRKYSSPDLSYSKLVYFKLNPANQADGGTAGISLWGSDGEAHLANSSSDDEAGADAATTKHASASDSTHQRVAELGTASGELADADSASLGSDDAGSATSSTASVVSPRAPTLAQPTRGADTTVRVGGGGTSDRRGPSTPARSPITSPTPSSGRPPLVRRTSAASAMPSPLPPPTPPRGGFTSPGSASPLQSLQQRLRMGLGVAAGQGGGMGNSPSGVTGLDADLGRRFAGLRVSPVQSDAGGGYDDSLVSPVTGRGDSHISSPGTSDDSEAGAGGSGGYGGGELATSSDDQGASGGDRDAHGVVGRARRGSDASGGSSGGGGGGRHKGRPKKQRRAKKGKGGRNNDGGSAASGRDKWPAANRKLAEDREARRRGRAKKGQRKGKGKGKGNDSTPEAGSVADDAEPVAAPRLSKRMRKRQAKAMGRALAAAGRRRGRTSSWQSGASSSTSGCSSSSPGGGGDDGARDADPRCSLAWMPLQSGVLGGQVVVLRGRLHTVVTFSDGSAAVVDSSQLARAPGRARRKRRTRQDAALHGARVVAWLDEPFAKARGRSGLTACCMTSGALDTGGALEGRDVVAAAFGRSVAVWLRALPALAGKGADLEAPVGDGAVASVTSSGEASVQGLPSLAAALLSGMAPPAASAEVLLGTGAGAGAGPGAGAGTGAADPVAPPPRFMFSNVSTYSGHAETVRCIASHVHQNGAVVASGDAIGSIHVWNAADGALLTTLRLCGDRPSGRAAVSEAVVQVACDAYAIVAAGELGTVCVWSWVLRGNRLTATCLTRTPAAHDGHVTAVALSPALQPLPYAATGGEDCLVRLWYRPLHAVTGEALGSAVSTASTLQATQSKALRLRGHNAPITALHLDTFKIVSTSADGVLKIWDAEELHIGRCLRSISVSGHPILSLFCTALTIVCGCGDGTVTMFTFSRQRTADGAGTTPSARASLARQRKGMQMFVGPKSGRRGGRAQTSNSRTTRRGLRDLRAAVARDNGATVDQLHHELNFSGFDLQVLHDTFLS